MAKSKEPPSQGVILSNKYELVKKIGEGSFGFVFSARLKDTNSSPIYAVKFEDVNSEQKVLHIELNGLDVMQSLLFYIMYFFFF
jgi:serine/threonine protein kinase